VVSTSAEGLTPRNYTISIGSRTADMARILLDHYSHGKEYEQPNPDITNYFNPDSHTSFTVQADRSIK